MEVNQLERGITTDVLTKMLHSCWFSLCDLLVSDRRRLIHQGDIPCHRLLVLLLCLIWPAICCRTLKSILALLPDTKGCLFTIHLPYTIENKQFHCLHTHRHTSSGDCSDNRMEHSTARVRLRCHMWQMFYNIIILLINAGLSPFLKSHRGA